MIRNMQFWKRTRRCPGRCLAPTRSGALALMFTATAALAAGGDTTDNSGLIPYDQAYFAFEVEGVLSTLKETPTWNEIEQMLDDPYDFVLDPTVPGNAQGWPSYRRNPSERRRSFVYRLNGDTSPAGVPCAPGPANCVEVPLPGFVIHPLNYNYQGGEELRLLNPLFEETDWQVPYQLELVEASNTDATKGPLGVARYEYTTRDIVVTAGEDRIEEGAAIDYNSPLQPDTALCIVTAEAPWGPDLGPFLTPADFVPPQFAIPEGSIICGGDTGEPGYLGFGVLAADLSTQYSTPAVPGGTTDGGGTDPSSDLPKDSIIGLSLYDPARGEIGLRDPVSGDVVAGTGDAVLSKTSLRIAEIGGTGTDPAYQVNSEAALEDDPAELAASNENDYVMNRDMAIVLGKALFWDMQVGSDGVQSCGTCHFKAGADDRIKNQLNPNHLGADLDLEVFANRDGGATPADDQDNNQDVVPSDFPFHKRGDPDAVFDGEPLIGTFSDANDVMSSMGVRFRRFNNIPPIGTWVNDGVSGVNVLPPDAAPGAAMGPNTDPIPLFQGLRRVEPRNTPTMIGAALNFDNFWDGRARHDFNGGSVFGPSDPFFHVFANDGTASGPLEATRQIIRHSSPASQAVGPPLSEFEMSFFGRNWPKIGKKLLQAGVTPLANQLVATDDSVLGPYSNQNLVPGMPGLSITYPELIQAAFYPHLWANTTQRLVPAPTPISSTDPFDGLVLRIQNDVADPDNRNHFTQMAANFSLFFGLAVQIWEEILVPDDAPMDRFYDHNPDSFASFGESGEPGLVLDLLNCGQTNPGPDGDFGTADDFVQTDFCFTEVGNFKRDPDVVAYLNRTGEAIIGDPVPAGGTRQPGDPDPLLGMDLFLGSNLSLKNINYRSLRCGECHAGGPLTDHTVELSNQISFNDWAAEFAAPGVGLFPEPLGRSRVAHPFALEGELAENAQDAVERNIADFCTVAPCADAYGNPVPTSPREGGPQGQALFDNGVYNIGLRPIGEDQGRGGDDPFGFPLSLSYLALKNLGGEAYSPGGDDPTDGFAQPAGGGIPLPNFDPAIDYTGGGLFEESAQDQGINPGFEEEPADPLLPPHLAPWASNINVGDESEIDEVFFGLNTLCAEPILEGFVDNFGPFNPATVIGETFNMSLQATMSAWPNVNRVNAQGSFKAPSLRNSALTGPFFHTGSYLTLRQVVDFYMRGGDFPVSNKQHRDFLIANMDNEDEALGGCVDITTGLTVALVDGACPAGSEDEFTEDEKEHIIESVVDFLLEVVDERVAYQRAPFDQPELFVPLDGTAPDNTFGRQGLWDRSDAAAVVADCGGVAGVGPCFLHVQATGQGGLPAPVPGFLGVTGIRPGEPGYTCDSSVGPVSHYCRTVQ